MVTREGVKIQQRAQNSTAKQGHNSTSKNPLNIDPGSVFNGGKSLSYNDNNVHVITSKR